MLSATVQLPAQARIPRAYGGASHRRTARGRGPPAPSNRGWWGAGASRAGAPWRHVPTECAGSRAADSSSTARRPGGRVSQTHQVATGARRNILDEPAGDLNPSAGAPRRGDTRKEPAAHAHDRPPPQTSPLRVSSPLAPRPAATPMETGCLGRFRRRHRGPDHDHFEHLALRRGHDGSHGPVRGSSVNIAAWTSSSRLADSSSLWVIRAEFDSSLVILASTAFKPRTTRRASASSISKCCPRMRLRRHLRSSMAPTMTTSTRG